jgi:hypothetical protein
MPCCIKPDARVACGLPEARGEQQVKTAGGRIGAEAVERRDGAPGDEQIEGGIQVIRSVGARSGQYHESQVLSPWYAIGKHR